MPPVPEALFPFARVTSITASLLCSGVALAESFLLIPRLLELPESKMLRQWKANLETSKLFFRCTTPPTAAMFCFLAWQARFFPTKVPSNALASWKLYLSAGALCASAGPYMWLAVRPTNRILEELVSDLEAVGSSDEKDDETILAYPMHEAVPSSRQLVDWWGVLILPRGVVLCAAGVLGLVAVL